MFQKMQIARFKNRHIHKGLFKTLGIMNIVAALLLFASFQAGARGFSKHVNAEKNSTNKKVEKTTTRDETSALGVRLTMEKTEMTSPPPIQITGKVVNETGEPLVGVSVTVRNGTAGTSTGSDGTYTITAPSDGALVFSFVGYTSQTININSRTTIDVKLERQVSALNDVVIIGYGTQKKRDLTGSISVVDGDVIAKQPST